MKDNHKRLLQFLKIQSTATTADFCAEQLQVSVRSIKSYIKEINLEYEQLILSTNRGYILSDNNMVLEDTKKYIPQTSGERKNFILNKLLDTVDGVSIFTLEEQLYISESTLKVELMKVKEELENHQLSLSTKNQTIQIVGQEKDKRKLASTLLYKEASNQFMSVETLQKSFPQLDIMKLKEEIAEILQIANYIISDLAILNVILHLAILIDRSMQGHPINFSQGSIQKNHHYVVTKKIVDHIEELYQIALSTADINEISILLLAHSKDVNYENITLENLVMFISKQCLNIVDESILLLNEQYYIQLDNSDFIIYFALHMNNLLTRLKYNYSNANPLTNTIKSTCPNIYECAVQIANIIFKHCQTIVNDDEIAYIALHLGNAIQEKHNQTYKINVALLQPEYHSLNNVLSNHLLGAFPDKLFIRHLYQYEDEISKDDHFDLLLSTVPLQHTYPKTINISPFFNQEDYAKLFYELEHLQMKKKEMLFKSYLEQLSIPEFFTNKTLATREEVLQFICQKMYDKGFVEANFYDKIMEREQLSTTAFGNIAIPHTMVMEAKKSVIYIFTNNKGIVWKESKVKLVILFAMNAKDKALFADLLYFITYAIAKPAALSKLVKSNSLPSFIETLSSLLK